MSISIVVLTFNESANIRRCLSSVQWANDILVVDSGSTDDTVEAALSFGARVVSRAFDSFAAQRNFALDHGALKNDWVLHIDADEVVSDDLRIELLKLVEEGPRKDAYRVPEKLILHEKWLKYSGMYPRYQVRFGGRTTLRFHMVGHGQREVLDQSSVGTIRGELIHFNFSKGISDWMTKHARYARDEALSAETEVKYRWVELFQAKDATERRRILKNLSSRMPMRPLLRFLYVYVLRRGFLDGRAGFRYALLLATYQWCIDLNRLERATRA